MSKSINFEELNKAPLLAVEQLYIQVGPSLILAPHPDDEALACGGMIQLLKSQDVPVFVIFMTSGSASHPNSKTHPKNVLADLREAEALDSCRILGVPFPDVSFLRQPDSQLGITHEEVENLAQHIANFIEENEIASIFMPWRRDPHKDHLKTYEIGKRATEMLEKEIELIEYPVWLYKNSTENDWPKEAEVESFKLDITEVLENKRNAIYAHKSQTSSLISDDPEGFILNDDLMSPFLREHEIFFFTPLESNKSLDKEYFDNLYAENPDPWNLATSEYEKEKYIRINTLLTDLHFKRGLELGCSVGAQTSYLAKHTENLLAVDINEIALESARKRNANLPNVIFEEVDLQYHFPNGPFDFISMCEMGYYLSKDALKKLFQDIDKNLSEEGYFLLVHWTPYVRDFPLTGRQVHQMFKEFIKEDIQYVLASQYKHERYEALLFRKN
ncbi:N-acetylglucosaminyl deacetylase, LmbE family [Flavobacteriaceae bacterium MAR_2010_188]|nr:N-acetylglucosaminyl deacetylase, LmbE family [Flavobacteriaceae bacterium MAR_2010_188]